jgi:hypothetical protein
LGMGNAVPGEKSPLTAQTRGGWIPVTSTGMREDMGASAAHPS